MKKKTAVIFGTFAPLHQGHIDLIQRAKRQCDQVWVVVSGYEGDRGEQVGLTLQKRFRYIRFSPLPYGLAGVVGQNVSGDFL